MKNNSKILEMRSLITMRKEHMFLCGGIWKQESVPELFDSKACVQTAHFENGSCIHLMQSGKAVCGPCMT